MRSRRWARLLHARRPTRWSGYRPRRRLQGRRVGEAADLLERELARILAVALADVPLHDAVERRLEIPAGRPPEHRPGLRGIDLEVARLVAGPRIGGGALPREPVPGVGEPLDDAPDGPCVLVRGPEVPARGRRRVVPEPLGEPEVPAQRVEDVLPRPRRTRIADEHRPPGQRRPDDVGYQPVRGP